MNYPHTCSVREPAIISQRLSTESLYREKATQVCMNYPHTCSVPTIISQRLSTESLYREKATQVWYELPSYRVSETPPSFLKDCQQKVCIERKPLRYGMNYPHTCSVRVPAIISQRLSTESLYREKATQV